MSDGLTDSRDNNYERPAKNQSELPSPPVERTQDEASLVDFAADPALGNPNSPGYFKSMDGLHPTNETYRRAAGSEEPKCDSVRDGLRCELEPDHIGSPGRPVFHHAVDSLGECQYWITPDAAPMASQAPLCPHGKDRNFYICRECRKLEASQAPPPEGAPKRPELHWIRGSNYCKASEVDACIDYLEGRVRELELVGDALKEIYNKSGEVWLEKILRAAYPEWKSRWDILEAEPHE